MDAARRSRLAVRARHPRDPLDLYTWPRMDPHRRPACPSRRPRVECGSAGLLPT